MIILACQKTETKAPQKDELLKQISPIYGNVEAPISDTEVTEIIQKVQNYQATPVTKDEIAVIETNLGTIKLEFFTDVAPNHCSNFKKLANSGFYNGTTFHRVIPDFMVQGGDILSRDGNRLNDGSGGPGYTVRAEFNQTSHEPGIVSTARRGDDIHSAGSQFFICVARTPHLDGQYTVFARVIEGMDVVYNIANVDRDPATDNPYERVIMKRVYVIPRTAQ
ncbi:peptidylprolyl isomerase [candidate division KSB1 bacterium]|nr:peptidylprolyl isomerase [candidate division KSB1 bacterium]